MPVCPVREKNISNEKKVGYASVKNTFDCFVELPLPQLAQHLHKEL